MVFDDGTIAMADIEEMNAQHFAKLVRMGARESGYCAPYDHTSFLLAMRVGLRMTG